MQLLVIFEKSYSFQTRLTRTSHWHVTYACG